MITTFALLTGVLLGFLVSYNLKESILIPFRAFTFLSNFVGLVSALVGTKSQLGQTLQVSAFLMLSTTFIVYHAILPKFESFSDNLGKYLDLIQHGIGPISFFLWFVFTYKYQISLSTILCSLIVPSIWLAYTLFREQKGIDSGYPFLRISVLGPLRVCINVFLIILANIFVAGLLRYLGN